MKEQAHLILSGRYLLAQSRPDALIENGAVVIGRDKIIALGTTQEMLKRFPGVPQIDTTHGLVMPGLINVHTHAPMALFRGMADDLPLMQWLTQYIFPVEATLTGEMVYQGALLSLCEMIRSGTTTFCDMYLFSADIARAVETAVMRAWLGEALYDFPSPNYGALENGFQYSKNLLDRYRKHPLINMTMIAHAVYTCSPTLLERVGQMAEQENVPLCLHLSETKEEVQTCKERYGVTPTRHLEQLRLLGPRLIAAHCVELDNEEIELLAKRGVKVAHCPESNMKLGSGIAPVDKMLAAGICVGLGTDGSASNNDADMFGEMASMARIHKARHCDPLAVSAQQTLYAATMGGAELLGAEKEIGSLEVGKKADCIVLDLNQPHLTPMYQPISHLVYAAKGSDVVHSVVNGKLLMQDRKLLTLDEETILNRTREIGKGFSRLKKTPLPT